MAYTLYLGTTMLPVTPSQLQTKIKNQNKAVTLINEGEVNQIKLPGLTEISFSALLPNVPGYPFARYAGRFRDARYYLDRIEKLKTRTGKDGAFMPFQFIVTREAPDSRGMYGTNIKVTLEDYKINENRGNGLDVSVDITLKQFRPYGTKVVTFDEASGAVQTEEARSAESAPQISSYTVAPGDHLWAIAQKYLNKGERYTEIYALNQALIDAGNKGSDNTKYTIHPGQVLTMPA